MKSIKEKAEAYDKIIGRAKKELDVCGSQDCDAARQILRLFPELRESEDEQHRKWILEYLYDGLRKSDEQFKSQFKCAINWLEKQAEQELTVITPKFKAGQTIKYIGDYTIYPEVFIISKVGEAYYFDKNGFTIPIKSQDQWELVEQSPADKIEPKFKVGDKIISTISNIPYYITEVCNGYYLTDVGCIIMFNAQDNFELVEQNPAWSEYDEEFLLELSQCCDLNKTQVQWLLSLKDRVQPQQEWTEEDEIYISDVLWCVEQARKVAKDENAMGTTWCAERWLKSLRPRSQWKPSTLQIEALESATENCAYSEYQDCLRELIGQLKKLI